MSEDTPEPTATSALPSVLRKEFFSVSTPIGFAAAGMALVEAVLILAAIFIPDVPLRWFMAIVGTLGFFYTSHSFYSILKTQPWVLYPPKDFEGGTDVTPENWSKDNESPPGQEAPRRTACARADSRKSRSSAS